MMSTPERNYEQADDVEARQLNDVPGDPETGDEPVLVEGSGDLLERWQRAQAAFVDDPREAVQEAGAIVQDVLGRLDESFESERGRLESTWAAGDEPSTEDLRLALRRYRMFFERLLAA
jgi:glutathione S-transferase